MFLAAAITQLSLEFGALELAERLCSVGQGNSPIEPLLEAFPGIIEIADNDVVLALTKELVVFGDYLGNGNMSCFHRQTEEVYFDHDRG